MKEEESYFQANIMGLRRITIPKGVCLALDLKRGDPVLVRIKKANAGKGGNQGGRGSNKD